MSTSQESDNRILNTTILVLVSNKAQDNGYILKRGSWPLSRAYQKGGQNAFWAFLTSHPLITGQSQMLGSSVALEWELTVYVNPLTHHHKQLSGRVWQKPLTSSFHKTTPGTRQMSPGSWGNMVDHCLVHTGEISKNISTMGNLKTDRLKPGGGEGVSAMWEVTA